MAKKAVSPTLALALALGLWTALQAANRPSTGVPAALEPLAVDLNRSPLRHLIFLPQIGPARAAAILADRAALGPYQRLADLERIKGIGPKTVEGMRGLARAGPLPPADSPETREEHSLAGGGS